MPAAPMTANTFASLAPNFKEKYPSQHKTFSEAMTIKTKQRTRFGNLKKYLKDKKVK